MLLEFTIKNYLSFANEVCFSMVAANTVKEYENDDDSLHNVWKSEDGKQRLLKAAAIYGPNGSGKSTLITGMADYRTMILSSFKDEDVVKGISQKFFKFSSEGYKQPVSMQMIFMINETRYRLGFQLHEGKVDTEWLYMISPNSLRESYCYKRVGDKITINSRTFKGASGLPQKTRNDSLFISTCAQYNVSISLEIKNWFTESFNILSGLDDTLHYTARVFMNDENMRKNILSIMNIVDNNIKSIDVTDTPVDASIIPSSQISVLSEILNKIKAKDNNAELRKIEVSTLHDVYDDEAIIGNAKLVLGDESLGTIRLFSLLGPWFDTLKKGGTIIIDEFGASLHTQLSIELLKLFYNLYNPHCAQLIFSTHDTNILRKELLRRDQVWFTEKDSHGVSDLYSLVEYKINQATSVRNDASFGKDYLIGRYGAIPYFGNIEKFIRDYGKEK